MSETIRGEWDPIHVDSGATYAPWTDGWAVGFMVTFDDGRETEFVYLNPSTAELGEVDTVFVYQGTAGDPTVDEAYTHFEVGVDTSQARAGQ